MTILCGSVIWEISCVLVKKDVVNFLKGHFLLLAPMHDKFDIILPVDLLSVLSDRSFYNEGGNSFSV